MAFFNLITDSKSLEMADIARCLTNLLNIPAGSIPLERGMGLDWTNIDKASPDMENDIATDIVSKVSDYEPRVAVSEVTFDYATDGAVTINILLEGGDGFGGE